MTELEKILGEILKLDILKMVFSCPYDKSGKFVKCNAGKMGNDGAYQFESFTKTQAFHDNVKSDKLGEKITCLLTETFRQAEIFTPEYVYGLKISSKGKLLHNRRKNNDAVKNAVTSNDKEKNHIITLDNAPQVFEDIGIIGKDGKIINSRYDKYKQICRFCEFIDDVVRNDPREEYFIVDFGCGKSYLTFVCYHYMTKIAKKKVTITGLDLKEKVIEDCNNLAKKYGYDTLNFLCMDIKDYKPHRRPDMVIALHACDIATDYALYNAYLWQTDYIFSVPCCQHEMNKKVKSDKFSLLTDYGLIKERFSALATDAMRAKTMEYCGYNTDVLEFIDVEHSPKNILLRCARTTKQNVKTRKISRYRLETFEREFNAKLFLHTSVSDNEKIISVKDKEFTVVCGMASMLLKDAMTVRSEVFGKEQNYTKGASRDKYDETAIFVNIYCEDKAISTSRMIITDDGKRLLGRIAVLDSFRGYGLGKFMLETLIEKARNNGEKQVHVISQKQALGFYEKLGFSVCADEFEEENITMIPVKKSLK